jgi:polar amino acid transport system substrate-binding protein
MVRRKTGLVLAAMVFVVLVLGGAASLAAEKEVYIVASDIAWPPFEWVDEAGNYVGFDLDVMRAIANLEGYKIEIIDIAFDSIIAGVIAGKYDIGASGFTITDKREEVIDFSEAYWKSDQAVLVRKDSGLNIITALSNGRAIGAQRGTTGADWIQSNLIDQGIDIELKLYETYPLAVLDLINGNLDAVVQDEPASQISVAKQKAIGIAGVIVTGEEFGFLVQQGDPYGLLVKISEAMKELRASGEWDKLVTKYFSE